MIESKWRGHDIYFDDYVWRYKNTNQIVAHEPNINCGHCGKEPIEEGHDGCLGTLIGVMNACCGHGNPKETYVQFLDGKSIHGEDAHVILEVLKKYRQED